MATPVAWHAWVLSCCLRQPAVAGNHRAFPNTHCSRGIICHRHVAFA